MSQETPAKRQRASVAADIASAIQGEDDVSKRIAEKRAERAQRGASHNSGMNLKLSVPDDQKDPRFEYRWAADTAGTGTRIHELRTKDWEVVPASDADKDPRNVGLGTTLERFANTRTVTKPDKHILMRKPKEFYEEDKAREAAKIKADEEALRQGDVRNPQGLSGPGTYIPAGGMKIENGR